jgi:hypothetical protein
MAWTWTATVGIAVSDWTRVGARGSILMHPRA